jgi:fucose permease
MNENRKRGQAGILALNFVAMGQHGIILLLLGPLVPSLMQTFNIGESTTGVLLSMGSVGFLAGPLIAGTVIDIFGIRKALIIGTAVELVFLALFGLSPLFGLLLVANFAYHFGSSFIETGANVMPTLLTGKRTAHSTMNLVHGFFSVGAFVGPFLVGLWLEHTGTWRPVFFFAAAPTAVLLVWAAMTRLPEGREGGGGGLAALRNLGRAARERSTIFGALSLLLYVGAEVGISSWIVYYLQKELGYGTVQSSLGLSVLWVFIMIGRYLNSLAGNKFSSKTLVTVSGIGGAIGVGLFLFASAPIYTYTLIAWIGLCLAGVFPCIMGELNNRAPERAGTVTAVMAMGAALGAGLFQWFIGFLAETVNLKTAFLTPGILQLLVIGSFYVALLPAKTSPSDHQALPESPGTPSEQ